MLIDNTHIDKNMIKKGRSPLPKTTSLCCFVLMPLGMMGSGGLIVMDEDNCMVDDYIIARFMCVGNNQNGKTVL